MEGENVILGIGSRLRRLLKLRGEALTAFAERADIPYRTLQGHISGKTKPNADQLAKISLAGIDVNFLLTGVIHKVSNFFVSTVEPDDEAAYIWSDQQVLAAIDRKAKNIITETMSPHLRDGDILTFDNVLATYLELVKALADIFVRSNPPLAEARRLGMSVENLIESVLGVAAEVAVSRLAARIAPPTPGDA